MAHRNSSLLIGNKIQDQVDPYSSPVVTVPGVEKACRIVQAKNLIRK
jgi:hypothetical protein